MSDNAVHTQEQKPDPELSHKMEDFALALTELSHEYGIGIEGAMLYQMEPDDIAFGYTVDNDSRLIRA